MIANYERKGPKPQGYKAVQVTFDEGFNSDKLYVYWVPDWWHVEPGDKLTVVVAGKHKTTTVRSVHTEGFVGAAHKCAVNYMAMPRDRQVLKEMAEAARKSTDTVFEEMQAIAKEADRWCGADYSGLEGRVLSHLIDDRFEGIPASQLTAHQRMYEAMAVPPQLLSPKSTHTGRISGIGPDQSNIPKESTMIDIKTITFINGKPVEECTDDELFAAIHKDEAKINELLKIENKPKALKDRVTKLEAGIKKLVEMMDARP